MRLYEQLQVARTNLIRERATSDKLKRALEFERAMHQETKHALKRSLAFGTVTNNELERLKDEKRNQASANHGTDRLAANGH